MARIPTVKIHHPHDPAEPLIINESDFNPAEHTLWADLPPPPDPAVRVAAILDATRQIVASGEGLTAAGIPKVDAIEAIVGEDITSAERDAAWVAYQEEQAQ